MRKVLCFLILFAFLNFDFRINDINPSNSNKIKLKKDSSNEVFSYTILLFDYYNEATIFREANGLDYIDYETFSELYYLNNIPIREYCDYIKTIEIENLNIICLSSSLNTPDYIIGTNNYTITPDSAFIRLPYYSDSFNYKNLIMNGDIVYETITAFNNIGHTGIISNINKERSGNCFYVETIEAVDTCVQFAYLDDDRIIRYGIKILRVNTGFDISNVLYFLNQQIGKEYLLVPLRANTSINSLSWYCSELIFAAYYYDGVDLRYIDGVINSPVPYTLFLSDYTYEIDISDRYVRIVNFGFYQNKWQIRILNASDFTKKVYYNKKMCFLSDCTNWSRLNDLDFVYVAAHSYYDVEIRTNFFATSIVFGCYFDDKRYITYADGLSSSSNTMVTRYAVQTV